MANTCYFFCFFFFLKYDAIRYTIIYSWFYKLFFAFIHIDTVAGRRTGVQLKKKCNRKHSTLEWSAYIILLSSSLRLK